MDIQVDYSGPQAQQSYSYAAPALKAAGQLMPEWNRVTNTLTVLIVTPKDIDPREGYKKHRDWDALQDHCHTPAPTRETADQGRYLDETGAKKVYHIMRKAAQNGWMPAGQFDRLTLDDPSRIGQLGYGIASLAFSQTPSTFNISDIGGPAGAIVVTMPDQPWSREETIYQISGLGSEYLKDIGGDARSWSLLSLGHEIGHGAQTPIGNDHYFCVALNDGSSSESIRNEGNADIAAALTAAAGQKLGLGPNLASALETLRALGNFYKSGNTFSVKSNSDLNTHLTTLRFDSSRPGFEGKLKEKSVAGASQIPPFVNAFADVLAGYVAAHDLKDALKSESLQADDYNAQLVGMISSGLAKAHKTLLAEYGYTVRMGHSSENGGGPNEVSAQPAYHAAAMLHMKKSGGLDVIKSILPPSTHEAFEDLIGDYFKALEKHASEELVYPEISARFAEILPKQIDYRRIAAAIFAEKMGIPAALGQPQPSP